MTFEIPVELAALRALAAWLSSELPSPLPDLDASPSGVVVLTKWPDADFKLPKRAVSIIYAGDRKDEFCQPTVEAMEIIHSGVSARIQTATATNLATAITLLNACKASYEAHRVSTSAHTSADDTNVVSAPNATDQDTAYALAVELYADINAHLPLTAHHPTGDTENALTGGVTNSEAGLVAAAEAIRRALNQHYVARVYVWRVRGCEQPVQLDVWAVYDGSREDIIARLEPLLNADPAESAGWDYSEPARNGVVVPLGDGWPGYAEFLFDAPRRETTTTSQKHSEFRAIYRGTCEVWLMIKKQSPRMARLSLRQVVDGLTAATATVSTSTSGTPMTTYTLS